MTSDGFLGRWSRRKLSEDKAPEPARESSVPLANAKAGTDLFRHSRLDRESMPSKPLTNKTSWIPGQAGNDSESIESASLKDKSQTLATPLPGVPTEAPLPTLRDAQALTPVSDFKPYLNQGVAPQVRNAAMKKLFADPRYNVMDRLDTYIDDYSKPDPIPESMLRKMVSAQFLGLFDEKKDDKDQAKVQATEAPEATLRDANALEADVPEARLCDASAPESDMREAAAPVPSGAEQTGAPTVETQSRHANPDLRLQPDHAAAAQGAGRGTG